MGCGNIGKVDFAFPGGSGLLVSITFSEPTIELFNYIYKLAML